MNLTDVSALLTDLRAPHEHGHRCDPDGTWWNPGTGDRVPCPRHQELSAALRAVTAAERRIRYAAQSGRAQTAVAEGMTGFDLTELAVTAPDQADGYRVMAARAITALADYLDRPQA